MSSTLRTQQSQLNSHQRRDQSISTKSRKVERACDACRRKKTKCDGPRMPDNICTNCVQTRKQCSYVEESKPRGPPKSYVTGLEGRLERMEALMKRLRPDVDLTKELGSPFVRDSWKTDSFGSSSLNEPSHSASTGPLPSPKSVDSAPSSIGISTHLSLNLWSARPSRTPDSCSESSYSSDDDELVETSNIKSLHSTVSTEETGVLDYSQRRFHGYSGPYSLVDVTRKFRKEHIIRSGTKRDENMHPSSGQAAESNKRTPQPRRPEFWTSPPWEISYEGLHESSERFFPSILANFPPDDLAPRLIELYFANVNPMHPLLHRPTFEQQWRRGLHRLNIWFACLSLSMFAVASRWCDDPRVIPDKVSDKEDTLTDSEGYSWRRAGLSYFEAAVGIHRLRRSLMHPTCLFEVQTFTLLAMYHRGNGASHLAWMFVGVGIRKAMDVGAHRKRVYKQLSTNAQELWKRAFLLLVAFDRVDSSFIGRSCLVGEEDYDLDLPQEVDDDYWDTEESSESMACRQPSGKPASVIAFNWWFKLTRIIAFAMRTIYAVDQRKVLFGIVITQRKEEVVTQLRSAIEQWFTALPQHLKWLNQPVHNLFAQQSTALHLSYNLVQTLIHRISVPAPTPHDLPSPAAKICIDAAKFCAEILDRMMRSGDNSCCFPIVTIASQICAGLLLTNIWSLKNREKVTTLEQVDDAKPPLAEEVEGLMDDVLFFVRVLEWAAPRWGDAAISLKRIKCSLPFSDYEQSLPPSGSIQYPMSDDRQSASTSSDYSYASVSYHPNPDELSNPQIYNADGWRWYSASQMTPVVAPSAPHPAQTLSSNSNTHPIPFPLLDDLTSPYPAPYPPCSHNVPHTFPSAGWPISPISTTHGPPMFGRDSGEYSDSSLNHEEKPNVMRHVNMGSGLSIASPGIGYLPDPRNRPFADEPRVLPAAWDKAIAKSLGWGETYVPECVHETSTGPGQVGNANLYAQNTCLIRQIDGDLPQY